MGRSESDCTGRFYFQAVEVAVAIPVELANQGGVHLPVVEAHIVDLPVKVPTAGGAVASDDQVCCTAGINRGGARSIVAGAIHIQLGCSAIGCGWEAGGDMVPVAIGQAGGGTGDRCTAQIEHCRSRGVEREFEEGTGATSSVLQKWLVCCGGLKPQSNGTTCGAIDAGVAIGTNMVIATV